MRRLGFWMVASLLGGISSHFVWIRPVQAQNQTATPQGVFRPGTDGVGYPRCLYCPAPKLPATTEEANRVRFVAVEAIIRPNGLATDIKVLKSAGSNLDEKAIEAVKGWRFKPALDQNGKPVPTITAIMVIFGEVKGFATGA
jgi:TonB family protein